LERFDLHSSYGNHCGLQRNLVSCCLLFDLYCQEREMADFEPQSV
jgi:hypothetical protein